jgi:oligopeptidase B
MLLNKNFIAVQLFLIIMLLKYHYYPKYMQQALISAPLAKEEQHLTQVHDQTIKDPYFWLRDKNWPKAVEDKEILKYLIDENDYADKVLFSNVANEKEKLFQELKGRIELSDKSTEVKKNNYYYYTRTQADKDYPIYCRKFGKDGSEEIILDVNELAKDHKFTKVGIFTISPDQNFLAYGVDHSGDEKYNLRILNIATKKHLADKIDNLTGQVIWHENVFGLFYTPSDENWRSTKVFFHILASTEPDNLVLEEKNHLYQLKICKSSSKEYLLINSSGHDENQFYTLKFSDVNFNAKLFSPLREKISYDIDHNGKHFYVLTNDQGPNFRLAITDLINTEDKYWQDYLALDKNKYLSSFDITANYLIANYKELGLPTIQIVNLTNKESKTIKFPDQLYTAQSYSTNFEEDDIRVEYSALTRPDTTYFYDYKTEKLDVLKTKHVPSGFNPDEYEVKREWSDNQGVKVPSTVFYKKSLFKQDGSNPLYLYGYGSYGISMPPCFRTTILSLVDRGFIFAIAHIRGGDDLGYQWYEDAKFLNKKRTFEDFIAVSEDLIAKKYTAKGNIVICGGSAGGMLVGNVINAKPELYKAAIAHVPFVDVLNTMLDDTLPLTPGEYKEWGNPKDIEYFKYIKSYSPYDNVAQQHYPHLFVTTSISDPRVGYYEPAKWVAKLRKAKTDENMLIFKTNMDAGHQGASGRFEYLKEVADDYLFIFHVFDIKL